MLTYRAQLMTGADNHLVGLGAMYETSKRQEKLVGADSPRALLKIDGYFKITWTYSGHLMRKTRRDFEDKRLLHLHGW